MRQKIITTGLILFSFSFSFAKDYSNIKIGFSKEINFFKKFEKFSCVIYTTILVRDQNGNTLSQDTFRTEGSGLSCIGADDKGIVRIYKRITVQGTNTDFN